MDSIKKYNENDLYGMIAMWAKTNNLINIERNYSLNAMMMTIELQSCLSPDKTFGIEKYNSFITSLSEEIRYGKLILNKINELREINNSLDIETPQEAKETINAIEINLKHLKSNLEKIQNFSQKTESFDEYKKDTEKYQNEISEILSVL